MTSHFACRSSTDIKEDLAANTIVQMRFLFIMLGLSLIELSLMHFASHAVYKSTLFLSLSLLIHANKNVQNSRMSNTLWQREVFLHAVVMVAALNAGSFPPFTAHYAKSATADSLMTYTNFYSVGATIIVAFIMTQTISIRIEAVISIFTPNISQNYLKHYNRIYSKNEYIYIFLFTFFIILNTNMNVTLKNCFEIWSGIIKSQKLIITDYLLQFSESPFLTTIYLFLFIATPISCTSPLWGDSNVADKRDNDSETDRLLNSAFLSILNLSKTIHFTLNNKILNTQNFVNGKML